MFTATNGATGACTGVKGDTGAPGHDWPGWSGRARVRPDGLDGTPGRAAMGLPVLDGSRIVTVAETRSTGEKTFSVSAR